MACYFLSENNSLSKRTLSYPLPKSFISEIEVPLKKLRRRQEIKFKEKLKKTDSFIFSEPRLTHLLPQKEVDECVFFNSVILRALKLKYGDLNSSFKRAAIYNPTIELSLAAADVFDNLVLFGENALAISNALYNLKGIAVPICSGTDMSDLVLYCREKPDTPNLFMAGYNIKTEKNSLGGDGIFFYPKGEYTKLTNIAKRPLTLREAALLSDFDKKASFNIVLLKYS